MSFYGAPEPDRLTMPVTKRDHIRGQMDAPMTLVEYGDYECPFCAAAYPLAEALIESLGDELCFAYRHFPLITMHPHAEHAAEAAESAAVQKRFWEMHDVLFRNQDALEDEDLARYAAALHLNVKRFIQDVVESAYAERIKEDFRSGVQSGVNGTPTFFINDLRYDGPRDLESMVAALNGAAHAPSQRQ
jgi:protein-disulfide isomerase